MKATQLLHDLGLQDEGAKSFVASWNDRITVIAAKSSTLVAVRGGRSR